MIDANQRAAINLIDNAKDAEIIELDEPNSTEKYITDSKAFDSALKRKNQVAVIGFWRVGSGDEYYCYHYFYVPNPCVREYARSKRKTYIHEPGIDKTTLSVS